MPTRTPKAELLPPNPTDPPFLIAILIGAMKTGDKLMVGLARDWLAEQGIRITIAKDAYALRLAEPIPSVTAVQAKGGNRG